MQGGVQGCGGAGSALPCAVCPGVPSAAQFQGDRREEDSTVTSPGASGSWQKNHTPSTFSASSVNHLNPGPENQETSTECFHLSHRFLLNFIRADNLYIHLQGNVI